MTQEEKDLLLKDLCARLPYGVITKNFKNNFDVPAHLLPDINGIKRLIAEYDLKIYLRPLSSMTDEEKKEEWELWDIVTKTRNDLHYLYTDFLVSHHLDYRGLIEKGLALEAPEGMYK